MINWDNYSTTFPIRYIQLGYFDRYISELINKAKPQTAIDIGGGTTGTLALKSPKIKVYLLDPFVNSKPTWMVKSISWDSKLVFDLVVARGSVNYLNKTELSRIKTLLKPGGIFVANTFINPPLEKWTNRTYTDALGQVGIESSRYNKRQKMVEHKLLRESSKTIFHSFNYYSLSDYKLFFPGVKVLQHGKNSAILSFKKPL